MEIVSKKIEELQQRRMRLIEQASAERQEMGRLFLRCQKPVQTAERLGGIFRFFARQPFLALGATAVLVGTQWRRVAPITRRAVMAWKIFQAGRAWWQSRRRTA